MKARPLVPLGRSRPDTIASHERAVERVIALMHDRLDEELSLRTMAGVANMSAFHFNRTFHQVTGLPPRHFLSALRLDRARHLLVTTKERITDVCFDVGYSSLGTFTRRFTEIFGVSPRQLRSCAASRAVAMQEICDVSEAPSQTRCAVRGSVIAPAGFDGMVFVGLFPFPVPSGRPLECKLLSGAGSFSLQAAAGRYCLYAFGIPLPTTQRHLIALDDVLRGPGGVIEISAGLEPNSVLISLRPRCAFDPPILVTLPQLLANRTPAAQPPERVA